MLTDGERAAVALMDALLAGAGEIGPTPAAFAVAMGLCAGLLPPAKVIRLASVAADAVSRGGDSTTSAAKRARLVCAEETVP